MNKIMKTVIFFSIWTLLFKISSQIYVPEDEYNQKPSTYTSGIKTYSQSNPSKIQYDHNYSRVRYNSYPSSNFYDTEEVSQRPFPVYNAHTYGARSPQSERSTVYVINGTRIRQDQNPARQIALYNKSKREPKVEIYRVCPDKATGQFVYESSCHQFLNCWKGRGYVQNCAPGTLFNPETLECDFPEKVRCITGPRLSILQKERSEKFVKQIGCPKEFSGLIPNYTDCSKFINCVSGIENFMDCPSGTLFDMDKNVCDFARKAHCFNGQNEKLKRENIDGKLDFESSGCDPQRSQCARGNLRYKDSEARCPSGISGLYKHPSDCSKFLNCANGRTYIQDCAPGTLFNPVLKICDFPYNVVCDNGRGYTTTRYGYDDSLTTIPSHHSESRYTPGSSTSRYNNQDRWTQDNHYNKGSTYGTTWGQNQYYNKGTNFYQQPDNHQINKGSVGIYQPGESGIYGIRNRTVGIYRDTNTNNYGTPNQNGWGRDHVYGTTQRTTTRTYYRDPYDKTDSTIYNNRGDSGTYSGHNNYNSREETGSYNGQTYNQGGDVHSSGESGTHDRPIYYNNRHEIGSHNGQAYYPKGYSHNLGETSTSNRPVFNRNQGVSGSYDGQNYHNRYNNLGETSTSNRPVFNSNKGVSGSYDGQNYHNRYNNRDEIGSYNGHNYNNYQGGTYGSTQENWPRDPYNRDDSIKSSTYGLNSNRNRDQYGNGHSGTFEQGGVYDQNNWRQQPNYKGLNSGDSYNHRTNLYGHNGLEQEPVYSGSTIPNRRGETGYTGRDPYNQREDTHYDRFAKGYNQHHSNNQQGWYDRGSNVESLTPNYDQVVNINNRRTTIVPFRQPYEPFFGTTSRHNMNPSQSNDYDDTISASSKKVISSTPRSVNKNWPPPFPSTDVNADYMFEYEDGEDVSLEAENSVKNSRSYNDTCSKSDFHCSTDNCIPKTLVCNGDKDCPHGNDELKCLEYVSKFSVRKNHKLAVLEKERWNNITIATCGLLCIEAKKFRCRSFSYRKIDKTCFLSESNEATTGGLISYLPFDYYELISEKIDCSDKYICGNKKCINRTQICDGYDDCGDRMDEKGCKPEDFGYSIKLTGSRNKHEGQIEVTAFGKTGYVCDDKFGLRDANVVCKEMGFSLGALEIKGNSFFAKNSQGAKPLYMMDDVTCTGNETRLMDCDFSGWGIHNCLGQEIAGVVCKTPQEKCPQDYWQCDTGRECLPLSFLCDGLSDCTDDSDEKDRHCDAPTQIRLVNGTNRAQGRVEIRHHGTWGTICDDDFNEDAAKVICRQLGYKGSATVKKDGYFGSGSGPIWLDQVFCTGNETSVDKCTHWNWGEHNCEHSEDVGVICSNIYGYERHSRVTLPPMHQEYPYKCGYRKDSIFDRDDDVHFRVVKGSIAKQGDYPWQAAIRVKGKSKAAHWCGAVVISEKFVLTAAHCLIGYPKGAYIVVAGDYNIDEHEGTEQEAYIDDYYIHESFREGHKMNNDIALVKLKGRGFRLNEDVQAICLPENSTDYEEDLNCTISGFGSIESGKSAYSHSLRAGWIPIQKQQICTMPHVYGGALTEGMICAGSLDEGIDTCDGDSGGPLACLHNGVFTLYGITSWGQHCGYANKPGVYVKVAHYRKWIDNNFYKHSTS